MEQIFYNTIHLHEHLSCNGTKGQRGHNEQRQQYLVQSAYKFLFSTAPMSIAGTVICYNMVSTTRVLENWKSVPTSAQFSLVIWKMWSQLSTKTIFFSQTPAERPVQGLSVGVTPPSVEPIPIMLQNANLDRRNRSVTLLSS